MNDAPGGRHIAAAHVSPSATISRSPRGDRAATICCNNQPIMFENQHYETQDVNVLCISYSILFFQIRSRFVFLLHSCAHMYPLVCTGCPWSCWDISCLMRPGHEKREIWREILWKERNPLIMLAFSCVVLFYHISPPSCACVRLCVYAWVYMWVCVRAPQHQSPTLTQWSSMSQLYHSVSASTLPPSPINPLATCLYFQYFRMCSCHTVFPLKVFLLHHASTCLNKWRNDPSDQGTRSSVRQLCHLIYSHNHQCVLSGTCSSSFKSTNSLCYIY